MKLQRPKSLPGTLKPLGLVLVLLLGSSTILRAAQVPAKLAVRILFKALSYDQKLVERCPKGLRIAVVALPDNPQSMAEAKEMLSAFQGVSNMRVKGLKIHAELLLASSSDELKERASASKINSLYLTNGWSPAAQKMIVKFSKARHWMLLTRTQEHVKNGISLGVYAKGGKPKIAIHARTAIELGAKFDSGLLRIAEVYR